VSEFRTSELGHMRRAVLTGANGVFGVHIAEGLLQQGIETHCVVRDSEKAAGLRAILESRGVNVALLATHICDLNSASSIASLAAQFSSSRPLNILINNAAATSGTRSETVEGLELQWSTNVLAYQRLTRAVLPHLLASDASSNGRARVVFVASNYAGGLNLSDPEFKARTYCGDAAYRASKQANRMLCKAWSERCGGVLFFSCHPGVATSNVSLGLGFDLDRSVLAAQAGAKTPLFLALAPTTALTNGGFYSGSKLKACSFCASEEENKELWAIVERYN
jgi:NAD(P)-dependent dehydrogenase (short-subunit alcohol dehydrogenase family)